MFFGLFCVLVWYQPQGFPYVEGMNFIKKLHSSIPTQSDGQNIMHTHILPKDIENKPTVRFILFLFS